MQLEPLELNPRISENTLTKSFENIRDSFKRTSIRNTIDQFKKRFEGNHSRSSIIDTTTDSIPLFNDDKLLQVLGLLADEFEDDLEEDFKPKRKNLVEFLGGPSLVADRVKNLDRTKTAVKKSIVSNVNATPVQLNLDQFPQESPIDSISNDLDGLESDAPNTNANETVHKRLHIELEKNTDFLSDTDLEYDQEPTLFKSKDLSKYLGASQTAIQSPTVTLVEPKSSPFRRLSLRKSTSSRAPIRELMNDPSPEVRNAIQLVQFHLDNPPLLTDSPRQSITVEMKMELRKEQIQALTNKAKKKLWNAIRVLRDRATSVTKMEEPVKILQTETIEYPSVKEQLERFKRESLVKPKDPIAPVISITSKETGLKQPFFDESRPYRVIDLVRMPKDKWTDLIREYGLSVIGSNETLQNTGEDGFQELSPAFIRQMLSLTANPIKSKKKAVVKREPVEPKKDNNSKAKVDVSSIIENLLNDSSFKREVFHDRLWELPNKEAYPDLFGPETESQSQCSSISGNENQLHNESEVNLFTVHLEEPVDNVIEDVDKIHPLEVIPTPTPKHRRWVTQFQNQRQSSMKTTQSSDDFGLSQLQRLNQAIEEETKGLEQLRRINAVLAQESLPPNPKLKSLQVLGLLIPSFDSIKPISRSKQMEVVDGSLPSFSSIPETPNENNVPELIKYMFKPPQREIFVDGVGAEEMVSAHNLDHSNFDQKSINSISELLLDAIESNIIS